MQAVKADSTPVVINELMALNETTTADPQREFDDWVEIRNIASADVDLSGMYLSDNDDNPRKWRIPDGIILPAGERLVIWLDENGEDAPQSRRWEWTARQFQAFQHRGAAPPHRS